MSESLQLFVVGSPRSGTTLLRNLLHGHPEIAMTAYESHFVPSALRGSPRPPGAEGTVAVALFLERFKKGLLYRTGVERGKFRPGDEELRRALEARSWEETLRRLFDLYCDKEMAAARIWGDKTPTYVDHLDLIDAVLSNGRFVHIIRDPRDQALSERAIWGKSLRRSSEAWRRRVLAGRSSRAAADGRFYELTYEALVANPERELSALCDWLGTSFEPAMLAAASGSDELGQMVGADAVSKAAVGGRRQDLSEKQEALISAYTAAVGRSLSYDLPEVPSRNLGSFDRQVLAMHDQARFAAYFVKRRGLVRGLRFAFGSYLDSRD